MFGNKINSKNYLEVLTRIFLVSASLCSAIFILEIVVRFLPPPYETGEAEIFSCDDSMGWVGASAFQDVVRIADQQVNLTLNSQGMHDTEHPLKPPADTFRILMLGDSFVHAVQVDEQVTAHQVLENYLNQNESATKYEVISGGVNGWGTAQELIYYQEQGQKFEPDLVLLMFFLGNDFENNLPGHVLTINQTNCYAPYFVTCDGNLSPKPLTYAPGFSSLHHDCTFFRQILVNSMGAVYQKSRLYQQLEPLIISRRPHHLFGTNYPSPFWALYMADDDPDLEQAWQTSQQLILQLQKNVEANGAKLAVAFFPWQVIIDLALLSPEQQSAVLKENPAFASVEINRPNQRMAKFLTEQNIPFVDLTPYMIDYQANHSAPLHFVGDSHWTVEGNRFVGETLFEWLEHQQLLVD